MAARASTRKTASPHFAVQRTGGGKVRIIAVHKRLRGVEEALTVTTVGDLATAIDVASRLNAAWSSEGVEYAVDYLSVNASKLPEPVVKAIEDALSGCDEFDITGQQRHIANKFKAVLIGANFDYLDDCQDAGDERDSGDSSLNVDIHLTPRQAVRLHAMLVDLGSWVDSENRGDVYRSDFVPWFTQFFPEGMEIGSRSNEWWESFALCFHDLAMDIEAGLAPNPATVGEAVSLWVAMLAFSMGEMDQDEEFDPDAIVEVLPEYDEDDDWEAAAKRLFMDLRFPGTFEFRSGGGLVLSPPERWHELLLGRPQRDPARLVGREPGMTKDS